MKTFLFIILFFLSNIAYSQMLILPLQGSGARAQQNVYYKDVDDVFNRFVGTWKYEQNGKIFTVVLQKKAMFFLTHDNNYVDALVGEYKYSENGVELVNTLENLNIPNLDIYAYNISGALIMDRDSQPIDRGVDLDFVDPDRPYLKTLIVIRRIFDGPLAKIRIIFKGRLSILPDENSPQELRVPEQEYILTKVN